MSFGSATPIEVAVQGPDLAANKAFADKIKTNLQNISWLRDLDYAQQMDYPTVDIDVNRDRAGQFGLTVADVARSLVTATSSTRFVSPNYWRDPKTGNAFQIQLEVPQKDVASISDVENLPIMQNGSSRPLVGDVANIRHGTAMGLVERYNMQRVVSLNANLHDVPSGRRKTNPTGDQRQRPGPERRDRRHPGNDSAARTNSARSRHRLLLAIGVIFLLLAANFQSFKLALVVILTAPAVMAGSLAMLLITNTTLNVQSFMGTIMAVGIAVANSILLVSFAETARREGATAVEAAGKALAGVSGRSS